MIKIAFIASRLSFETMQPLIDSFHDRCVIDHLAYSPEQSAEEWMRRLEGCDGLLFGGWLQYAALSSLIEIDKPYECIIPLEADYYRTMLKACIEHPEVPLEQIMTDRAGTEHGYTEIDSSFRRYRYLDVDRIMGDAGKHFDLKDVDSGLELIRSGLLKLVKENDIKIVVSAMSRLESDLLKQGVLFYHIYPGFQSVSDTLQKLLNRIESGNLTNRLAVNCIISSSRANLGLIENIVERFVIKNGLDCISAREGEYLRLFLPFREFQSITAGQNDCRLSREILRCGIKDLYLGWGLGYDLSDAKANALRAISISKHSGMGSTFIVSEKGNVTGPMLSENRLFFKADNDEETLALSYIYDISQLHIKKLLALTEINHNSVYTGESLAAALNVSQRTARRILAKLASNGGAELAEEKPEKQRGRPRLRYRILLLPR